MFIFTQEREYCCLWQQEKTSLIIILQLKILIVTTEIKLTNIYKGDFY